MRTCRRARARCADDEIAVICSELFVSYAKNERMASPLNSWEWKASSSRIERVPPRSAQERQVEQAHTQRRERVQYISQVFI